MWNYTAHPASLDPLLTLSYCVVSVLCVCPAAPLLLCVCQHCSAAGRARGGHFAGVTGDAHSGPNTVVTTWQVVSLLLSVGGYL